MYPGIKEANRLANMRANKIMNIKNPLNFDEYQEGTSRTAIYPGRGEIGGVLYTALGLGEAGEVQNKVKKILRDDNGQITPERREAIAQELGGNLWYISQLATELGLSLAGIAQQNLDILASRQKRGVISGDGDER
jgi:NTP pyrophosphatase (non-canonical NTP hydrolase)